VREMSTLSVTLEVRICSNGLDEAYSVGQRRGENVLEMSALSVIWPHSCHSVRWAKRVEAGSVLCWHRMEILPLPEAVRVSVGGYMTTAYFDESEYSVPICPRYRLLGKQLRQSEPNSSA
jgi:hypothetical protein